MSGTEAADAALLDLCAAWQRNRARLCVMQHAPGGDDPVARAVWMAEVPVMISQGHVLDSIIAKTPATTLEGMRAKGEVLLSANGDLSATGGALLDQFVAELFA